MSIRTIRIGLDLDGVVAAPLFGSSLVRLRQLKERLLARVSRRYYYPGSAIERLAWLFLNNLRQPLPDTIQFLQKHQKTHQFYLITSRFKFLEKATRNWLKKYQLTPLFQSIHLNNQDLNPSVFKAETITKLQLDAFVDDDSAALLELVHLLSRQNSNFRVVSRQVSRGFALNNIKFFWLTQKGRFLPGIKTIPSLSHIPHLTLPIS